MLWNHGEGDKEAEFVLSSTLYTSLLVTNVDPGKHYKFVVRACNHCGYSKPSPILSVLPKELISYQMLPVETTVTSACTVRL